MGTKISELPTGSALTGDELAELTQNGVSIQAPLSGFPTTSAAIIAALGVSAAVIPNGSASAPSLALVNSSTTGFYRAGADQLGIAVAGSNLATFSSTGLALANSLSIFPTSLLTGDDYFPYLHTPIKTAGLVYKEFGSSDVADILAGSAISVKNTGAVGVEAAVGLLVEAEAADAVGYNTFGANIVLAGSVDQAQGVACEIDVVMGVDDGSDWLAGGAVGLLVAAQGFAHPDTALQIHANVATASWDNGILFHHRTGFASITGSLIKSDTNDTAVDIGVNFLSSEFTTADWVSRNLQVDGAGVSNVVNRVQVQGGATGNGVKLTATGNDTDISMQIQSKAAGIISLVSGAETLRILNGSGVDHLGVQSATGAAILIARGSSTNADLNITGKGTGGSSLIDGGGARKFRVNTTGIGFFATTPVAKQDVTGSRGGNAALADLLTKLAAYGLITDSTSA